MHTKEDTQQKLPLSFRLYLIAFIITFLALFGSLFWDHTYKASKTQDFSAFWYSDSSLQHKADLHEPEFDTEGKAVFYAEVPDVAAGDCLWFRAKNGYAYVFVDGEERYHSAKTSSFYGKSPGTYWVNIPLESADTGTIIKIELQSSYDDGSCYMSEIQFGNSYYLFSHTMIERFVGSITCMFLLFLGLMFLLIYFVTKNYFKITTPSFLYLACFSIITAGWSLAESKILQIFIPNSGAIHNFACMGLTLLTLPLFMFFHEDMGEKYTNLVHFIAGISLFNIILCFILHFTGLKDFHETLNITQIVLAISALGIIFANYQRLHNTNTEKKDIWVTGGMIMLGCFGLFDIIRYRMGHYPDTSMFTRIGTLIYVITLGITSMQYVASMIQKGMQAEFVSHLAYEDALTELGNRTAYKEKVEQITGQSATFFLFDINNLKYVNDNLGHQAGDLLIKSGAELITNTFAPVGTCYRIGGDEFVCIAETILDTKALLKVFYADSDYYNENKDLPFPVIIAAGASVYDGTEDIKEAVNRADKAMYAKKAELKKQQAPLQ